MSTVHIGENPTTKDFEFGEFYHVAAYLAADDSHRAVVCGEEQKCQPYVRFLNALKPNSTKWSSAKPDDSISPRSTSKYFENSKAPDLELRVAKAFKRLIDEDRFDVKTRVGSLVGDNEKSCFLWVREGKFREERNLTGKAYMQLCQLLHDAKYRVIPVGPSTEFVQKAEDNLICFYEEPEYRDNIQAQMTLLNYLCEHGDIRFSIGMKSGGMDGLAFLRGMKTIYFGRSGGEETRMKRVRAAFSSFIHIPITYKDRFEAFGESELDQIRQVITEIEFGSDM